MFTEAWCRGRCPGRRTVEPRGRARLPDLACARLIDFNDETSRYNLRVVYDFAAAQHRCAWYVSRVQRRENIGGTATGKRFLDLFEPLLAIR